MNLAIKATHTTLTPALKRAVQSKFSVIEPFLKPEHKLHVEIEVDSKHKSGEIFRAEVTVHPEGFFADCRAADAYEAIDMLVPKVKQHLAKTKDKKISERRKLGSAIKRGK